MKVHVRSMKDEDRSLIYSTWLRGLYHGSDWFKNIDKTSFFKHYAKVVDLLLAKQDTQIRIACDPEDHDVIYGYIILGHEVVHYCFVKESWRAKGIAKLLHAEHPTVSVTHITKPGNCIRLKNLWTFDPFKI